jgi:hypothetical protein
VDVGNGLVDGANVSVFDAAGIVDIAAVVVEFVVAVAAAEFVVAAAEFVAVIVVFVVGGKFALLDGHLLRRMT